MSAPELAAGELIAQLNKEMVGAPQGHPHPLRKHRFESRQTTIHIHRIATCSHETNTPLLSCKLTKACADLKVELIEESTPDKGVVQALGDQNRIKLR
jgi:hypothetical protein